MKHLFTLLILGAVALSSCSKKEFSDGPSDVFKKNEAVITGYDMTECLCCGGYIISIVNNPPYGKDFLTKELPANMQITQGSSFPVYVTMEWSVDTTYCDGRFITIHSMKRK
jgi:hypothetical protein